MDEFIKLLNKNQEHTYHYFMKNTIYINVISNTHEAICSFCGNASSKARSHYKRSFQVLRIQGSKVIIILNNSKIFCNNLECKHTTFAETFKFLPHKGKNNGNEIT